MKRKLQALVFVFFSIPLFVQAGGLMTNTNQSASYIRMPVMDAVVGPEGVYYNPAGLAFLQDGLHISLSNQTISQKRTINSTFPGLNQTEYIGTVSAPLFPSVYATYKRDRLAFSVGVNPIGGGGSALFEEGLPSFAQQVAVLPGLLTQSGIPTTQYGYSTNFDAQSIFWGVQANATYALNDVLAVSAGLRYVTADNSYSGYLKDITFNPNFPVLGLNGSVMTSAPGFFGAMSSLFGQLAGVGGSLGQIVNAGFGHLTLGQALSAGIPGITAESIAAIYGGFGFINPAVDPANLSIAQIQGAYQQATPIFQAQQANMAANQQMTSDKEVDVAQKGSSIAPIFGIHLQLSENFNLAVKYEHRTPLKVKNETAQDDLGVYPNGLEIAQNLPSLLSVGVGLGVTDKLTLNAGVHYYFDKSAEYGKIKSWGIVNGQLTPTFYSNDEIIDKNFFEAGMGFEYKLTRNFLVSAGYLRTQTGVNELYHSDQSHSMSTNTVGAGFRFQFTNLLALNVGGLYSHYVPHTKQFAGPPSYEESYDRNNMVFAVGIDIKL
jgi:long-chain fatty acid transport protein